MKIHEFEKYKRLLESNDPEQFSDNEKAMKIYSWMEETGRIDEGFFGAIWSWLKRNFSPTAIRLHRLADEFGAELSKELQAEFARKEDSKDKAAQMRSSWAGKMSGDIQERMEIIAKDDPEYADLVRYLINKETLKAKKANLRYLDEIDRKPLERDLNKQEAENEKAGEKIYRNQTREEKQKVEDIRKFLRDEIKKYTKVLSLSFDSDSARKEFIDALSDYGLVVSKKYGKPFDEKSVALYLEELVKVAEKNGQALRSSTVSDTEAIKTTLEEILKLLKNDSDPLDIPRLKNEAIDRAKKKLTGEEKKDGKPEDVKDVVTTPETKDVISNDDVDDAIDAAKDDTGKSKPSDKEVVDEMKERVKEFFKINMDYYYEELTNRVKSFNSKKPEDKKKFAGEFEYALNPKGDLTMPAKSDIMDLVEDFARIMGLVVPYHEIEANPEKAARSSTLRYLFEIYAITKDGDNKLKAKDVETIVNNIKTKYSR